MASAASDLYEEAVTVLKGRCQEAEADASMSTPSEGKCGVGGIVTERNKQLYSVFLSVYTCSLRPQAIVPQGRIH